MEKKQEKELIKFWIITIVIIISIIVIAMWLLPQYNVYSRELSGKAQLREAEWNKQIAIEEARALKESALLKAEAEVIRAEGVAKANEIIGSSLKDNEAYLRYLWINALYEDSNSIIYVPTEANLPILEAGKR
jgi:regulator of protease activity HflC (stomatin/prohibitin superfamily)